MFRNKLGDICMKNMISSRKAVELSLNVVIVAAILLIVMIVVIAIFGRLFGQEAGQIEEHISALGDADRDNIINLYDACPCTPGEDDYEGCPSQSALDHARQEPKPKTC